jgi:hypothetical protein
MLSLSFILPTTQNNPTGIHLDAEDAKLKLGGCEIQLQLNPSPTLKSTCQMEVPQSVTTAAPDDDSVTPGVKAHYKFNANTNDSGPNGYHATESNKISYTTDRNGDPNGAIQLGGSDDGLQADMGARSWVQLPNSMIDGTTDFTFCAWIKMDTDSSGWDVLLSNGIHNTQFWYGYDNDNNLFRQHFGNGTPQYCTVSVPSFTDRTTWNHLCVVGEMSTGTTTAWTNGEQVTTGYGDLSSSTTECTLQFTDSLSQTVQDYGTYIGTYKPANYQEQRFQGAMDDVYFYDRKLSESEIAALAA